MVWFWSSFSRPKASLLYGWGWAWGLAKPKRATATTAAAAPPASREEEEEEGFDPAANPPPFRLGEIRAAIPSHCWVKDPWRSMSYVARDAVAVVGLAAAAVFLDSWAVWPLYWLAQGTMFWAIFVLGHDCGHGSFSDSARLNNIVGQLLHSIVLVPYHGWRISHRTHHQNHGHVEKDESWHPVSKLTQH